jgi:hypothetical protein
MWILPVLGAGVGAWAWLKREKPEQPEEEIPMPEAIRPPVERPSPLKGIKHSQWVRFCNCLRDPRVADTITDAGHIGQYRFTWPRLSDLGWAVRVERKGKVWTGLLVPPLTMERFLASPRMQDQMFELSSADYTTRMHNRVGTPIDGTPATLSGLLAVAHRAGLKGAHSWLINPQDRKRFPNTTRAFRVANGVF